MARHKPVPRTLSEVIRKISKSPPSPPQELISPEELRRASQTALPEPEALFQGVKIRPDPPQNRTLRPPEVVFGKQALAQPGAELESLELLTAPPLASDAKTSTEDTSP